jgi:DNA-binding CsgD family transcriptional regulator
MMDVVAIETDEQREIILLRQRVQTLELTVAMQTQMLDGIKILAHQLANAFGIAKPWDDEPISEVIGNRRGRRVTGKEKSEMVQMYGQGQSIYRISRAMNLNEKTVKGHLIEAGVHVSKKQLTTDDVHDLIDLHIRLLWSARRIAAAKHLSVSTVSFHLKKAGVFMPMARRPHEFKGELIESR